MKKFFFGLIAIIGIGLAVVYTQLDLIVEDGIETFGPEALKVGVTVGSVKISPLTGNVQLTDLAMGQPEGFGEGPMMQVGDFQMKVEPSTLMSDHVIVDEIVIDRPMFDARLIGGQTNFQALQKHLNSGADSSQIAGQMITMTIRSLRVTSPQVAVSSDGLLKVDEDVKLADFALTNLGTDEKGLSPKELARHVMDTLQPQIAQAMVSAGVGGNVKDLAKGAREKLEGGVGNLLGKLRGKKEDGGN